MLLAMSIADNITFLRERMQAAARRSGREPGAVKLVGVTKGVRPEAVSEAMAAGLGDFGENFVQEAETRIQALGGRRPGETWHFIGHLQSNKAASALRLFDIIQSVDSLLLAEHLSRRATSPVSVLLEVNVAAEASKFGFPPAEAPEAIMRVKELSNLQLIGLMTVAPALRDQENVRPVFRELRRLAESHSLPELSMGMTDDYETAIEEGATIVRIGRAIFGERRA